MTKLLILSKLDFYTTEILKKIFCLKRIISSTSGTEHFKIIIVGYKVIIISFVQIINSRIYGMCDLRRYT